MLPGAGFDGASVSCQIRLNSCVRSRGESGLAEHPASPIKTSVRKDLKLYSAISLIDPTPP